MRDDVVKPAVPVQGMTMGAVIVLLLAIASVFALAAYQAGLVTTSSPVDPSVAWSAFKYFLAPHLVVIVLIATGIRRTGDVAAVAASCWTGIWGTILTMLSGDPKLGFVVLLQILTLVAALVDLRPRADNSMLPLSPRARLLGLSVPLVIALLGYRMMAAPAEREAARRAALTREQRAGEMGWALEPSPLLPDSVRLRASDWADYSVLGRFMGLARCVESFRGDSGGPYPQSLHVLQAWSLHDSVTSLGCASKLTWSTRDTSLAFLAPSDGRIIRYTPPTGPVDPYRPAPFTLESEAIWDSAQASHVRGRAGVRNYLLDTAGRVHVTAEHRRVTPRDPVLPVCNPPEVIKEVAECGPKFVARRRWGAVQLPFAMITPGAEPSAGELYSPMLSFHPMIATDSVARVTIDWGDAAGRIEVVPAASQRSYGPHDWNRFVGHVYRVPGRYRQELTITTRGGEVYAAHDSVIVGHR